MRTPALFLVAATLASAAPSRLTTHELSGFLKVITSSVGEANRGRIDCLDDKVAEELQKNGVALDPAAKVAYADSLVQVRTFESMGKLVVCSDKALLREGATIAVVKEDGKPVIYIHNGNRQKVQEGGITISDTLVTCSADTYQGVLGLGGSAL